MTALWRGRRSVWGQTPQNRDKHSCVGPPAGSQQVRRVEAEQLSQSTGQLGQQSPIRRDWNPLGATEQQAAQLQKTWPAAEGTGWTLAQYTIRQSQPPVKPSAVSSDGRSRPQRSMGPWDWKGVSLDRGMDKEGTHIYDGILLSHREE